MTQDSVTSTSPSGAIPAATITTIWQWANYVYVETGGTGQLYAAGRLQTRPQYSKLVHALLQSSEPIDWEALFFAVWGTLPAPKTAVGQTARRRDRDKLSALILKIRDDCGKRVVLTDEDTNKYSIGSARKYISDPESDRVLVDGRPLTLDDLLEVGTSKPTDHAVVYQQMEVAATGTQAENRWSESASVRHSPAVVRFLGFFGLQQWTWAHLFVGIALLLGSVIPWGLLNGIFHWSTLLDPATLKDTSLWVFGSTAATLTASTFLRLHCEPRHDLRVVVQEALLFLAGALGGGIVIYLIPFCGQPGVRGCFSHAGHIFTEMSMVVLWVLCIAGLGFFRSLFRSWREYVMRLKAPVVLTVLPVWLYFWWATTTNHQDVPQGIIAGLCLKVGIGLGFLAGTKPSADFLSRLLWRQDERE